MEPPDDVPSPGPSRANRGGVDFARVLDGVGREIQRGEALVGQALAAARGGHSFAPAELIALQAGVYRYGEAVDLASKLVDRATSGLKAVLQG